MSDPGGGRPSTCGRRSRDAGYRVHGTEKANLVRDAVNSGRAHFSEAGLDVPLAAHVAAGRITCSPELPLGTEVSTYIITVGTPLTADGAVNLGSLEEVLTEITDVLRDGNLIVLRSTVKPGTSRQHAKRILDRTGKTYCLAFCPERTLEGKALFELTTLPQVASSDYKKLADSTKRNWGPWLDRIAERFGELRIEQFNRPDKIRPVIRRWRSTFAETPRAADYGMQVLSRVLSYAVDPLGKLASNPCEGIKQLYSSDRSEIIWTDADISQLRQHCSPEVARVVDLAAHTGLRVGDLVRLAWSHVGDDAIIVTTGKSRHQREAIIPLYDDLRAILAHIPRCSPVILTNTRRRPWTVNGLASSFGDAKKLAWPKGDNLHFHDLRGTAATKFYLSGLTTREIAEIMAWEEDTVDRIIRRYVGRDAAIKERIRKLNESRS